MKRPSKLAKLGSKLGSDPGFGSVFVVWRSCKLGSDPGFWGWHSCGRGVSRLRRALLSFASPKESKQRKGDPGRRPATRGPLRYSVWAGAAELAATRLKQSSPFFRPNLRCSASHKGPERRHGATSGLLFQTLFRAGCLGARWFSPSRRQRRATEALAEKGRGLSEGVARVPQPPPTTSSAGNPAQQGADAGSPFLCALSFGEAKESAARLKREKQRLHERKTKIPWSVPGLPKGPERRHGTTSGSLFQTLFRVSSFGVRRFSPSRRQRRATEGFAERARGLSEGRSPEFRSAREDRVAQGTGEAGADAGSPSFCLLFLGEARKSKARRKRETPPSHERKTQIPWSVPGLVPGLPGLPRRFGFRFAGLEVMTP